jgi:hypothetical protein
MERRRVDIVQITFQGNLWTIPYKIHHALKNKIFFSDPSYNLNSLVLVPFIVLVANLIVKKYSYR